MKLKLLSLSAAFTVFGAWQLSLAYDANNDGMSDVFADHYGLSQNSAAEDEDKDGYTNLEESKWGTDPTQQTSPFTSLEPYASDVFIFRWDSIEGKRYGVEFTDDLLTSWDVLGNTQRGTGSPIAFGTQVIGSKGFWRLKYMGEQDSDADGLTFMEESILQTDDSDPDSDNDYILDVNEFLAGTQPMVADTPPSVSFEPLSGDYAIAQSITLTNLALPNYIYYTIDGSEPTLFSTKYNGTPIDTGDDALLTIRAKVILPNGTESAETAATYRVGSYSTPSQTVYYGWITAQAKLGYVYNTAELTDWNSTYTPENYLVMGDGWIDVGGNYTADTTATSQNLFYGYTRVKVGSSYHDIIGYSTDNSVFYTFGSDFKNYRPVGWGWIKAHDQMEAEIAPSNSVKIYYTSGVFSYGSGNLPFWLFTTSSKDQLPSGDFYAYPVTDGWILSINEILPDTSKASSEVRYGHISANPSGQPNIPFTTNYSDEFNFDSIYGTAVGLGKGWATGNNGSIPDKTETAPTIYFGHKGNLLGGADEYIYAYEQTDILPSNASTWPYRRFIQLGKGYLTNGFEYEVAWTIMPQTVYRGTENTYPDLSLPNLTNFLAYDNSKLSGSIVTLGSGWIENNNFIEYIDDEDGLSLADEIANGTNPNYFDTDGDLLPDDFEVASTNLNPLVPDPLRGQDFDLDGLDSFEELVNGSDPDEFDTDGDQVGDGEEVDYGTDPNDDTIKPFDPYDYVGPVITDPDCQPLGNLGIVTPDGGSSTGYTVEGRVGDWSSSESERWRLKFKGRRVQSDEYGVVDDYDLNLNASNIYEIKLEHIGTDPAYLAQGNGSDYDYEATITDMDGFLLSDPDTLLQANFSDDQSNANVLTEIEAKRAYIVPLKSISYSESYSGGDAVGPRYRKVSVNGRPLPDAKPEQESETEQHAEETYIDAFDLSLHHDTSYVYTPLASSDLVLQASASVRETSWSDRSGIKPHESLTMPFGAGWSSNLCSYVESIETWGDVQTDPVTVNVIDESGRSQRFATNNLITFFPWPSSRVDKKTWLNTLDGIDTNSDGTVDRLIYTKKYGTVLTYDLCDAWFMYSTDRIDGSNEIKRHRYWRLMEVEDRYGNIMSYDYDADDSNSEDDRVSLIPQVIQSNKHVGQFISIVRSSDCRRIERITDSRANHIDFAYDEVQVFGSTLKQLSSVSYPDGTVKRYGYQTVLDTEVDTDSGRITNHFHCNLNRITDKSGNSHIFHYGFDRSKTAFSASSGSRQIFAKSITGLPSNVQADLAQQLHDLNEPDLANEGGGGEPTTEYNLLYGQPRRIVQVDLPNGIGSATFAKTAETETVYGPSFSAASGTTVTDAVGNVTAYTFSNINGEIVDVDDTGDSLASEWMIYYTQMEVHHGALEGEAGYLGKETFNFDLASGLSLSSMTDFSGNTTTWLFEDDIVDGRTLPHLENESAFMSKWADPTKKVDALLREETYQYGNFRVMSQVNDVHGTVTNTVVDAKGRRSSMTVTDAGGTKLSEETYTYADQDSDPSNDDFPGFMVEKRIVAYQNLSGKAWEQDLVTQYVPDSRGRLFQEIVDPDGLALTTEYGYDFNNNRTSVTDPRDNITSFTYDPLNRLVQVTNPIAGVSLDVNGDLVEAVTTSRKLFDSRGNLAWEIDENGHSSLHFYDALSRKVKTVRDMDGLGLPTLPDLNDPQIVELDEATHITAADIVTQTAYTAVNSVDSTTDARGTVTKNFYDALQRIRHTYTHFEASDANTNGTENGTTVADSSEKAHTEFVYSIAENTGASGFSSGGFKPTQIIRHDAVRGADGASGLWTLSSHATYDKVYRATQTRAEYKPSSFNQTDTVYGTIASGKETLISTVTDDRSKVIRTTKDGLNRAILVEDAVGTTDEISTQTFYTSTGLKWKSIDPNDNETETEYDLVGRAVKVYQPDPLTGVVHPSNSPVTETVYDAASNVKATINPRGYRWDFTFDARNRKVKEEAPAVVDAETVGKPTVRPTTHTYLDGVGNVIKTIDPRSAASTTLYDHANRAEQVTTPAVPIYGEASDITLTSSSIYDKNSNVIKAIDFGGNATVNFYDRQNRLTATATNPVTGQPSEIEGTPNADDIVVSNTYDDAGNLIQVVDGEGAVTGFRFDGLARSTQTIWDEGADLERRKTLVYDALVLTSRTNEKSQVTNYLYDDLHRLEDVSYVGRSVDNRHYTYDDNSNILTVTHPNESNTLRDTVSTYDALNRVTGETSADVSHIYVLDKAGNRLSGTYGNTNTQLVSTYDKLNQLETCTEGSRVTTYAYNLNGSIVEKVLPNDVTVACSFDLLGRKSLSTNTADGAAQPFAQYIYSHDKQGNLVEIDESYPAGNLDDRIVFNTYDKTFRLENESISTANETTVTAYQYDDGHNRTQKSVTVGAGSPVVTTYTYGDGSTASTANSNQLVSFTEGSNTVSFDYDANGNRESRTENSQTDTYSYDYENRLLGFNKLNGADAGNHSWAYDYRTRRVEFDKATGSSTTSFSFSGGTSVQEYTTSSSTPDVEFIRGSDYGGGIGGILYSLRGGVPSIKHYNSRGDVVAATNTSGSLTWQSQYEAFGTITDEDGSTLDRQKSNTKDQDLANYANEGFRWRDLETGMFFQRDPAGFVDGPNVYTYVLQNAWTAFDPTGLRFEDNKDYQRMLELKNSDKLGDRWKAMGYALKSMIEIPSEISYAFSSAKKELKNEREEINRKIDSGEYNPAVGALARFGLSTADFSTGISSLVMTPQDTVPEIPEAIANTPSHFYNTSKDFWDNPSLSGFYDNVENAGSLLMLTRAGLGNKTGGQPSTPASLADNSMIKLYHHTDNAGGAGINTTGVLAGSNTPGLWRPWRVGDVYLTTKPQLNVFERLFYGLSKSKTNAVVPVVLPKKSVGKGPLGIRIHQGDIDLD
jgi:RHS repeat-associated protein